MRSTKGQYLFLLLSPPPFIIDHVRELKKMIRLIVGHSYESYYSKAHISILVNYFSNTDHFLYTLEDKMQSIRSFELVIKGFKVLHHGSRYRTICLDIANKNPVHEVMETVHEKENVSLPHITLAKRLSLEEFDKVWSRLQDISYSNYFRCNQLTVLRREGRRWNPYMEIPFAR